MKIKEVIINALKKQLIENRLEQKGEYSSCLMSDLLRMEIVDTFFKNVENDESYNLSAPDFFKLIDTWDGYDDQVYIQNNLINNEFILWEGWVEECWKSVYLKPEYKILNKTEVIDKIIKDRFPRIGSEFGYKIKESDYFKYKGKFIMKVVFSKQ